MRREGGLERKPMGRTPPKPGIPQWAKDALWQRANGRCESCGRILGPGVPFSRQHRHPRMMGGTSNPRIHALSNLGLLCGSATTPGHCHLAAERRDEQMHTAGWWLERGEDPAATPVVLPFGRRVLLTDDGHYRDAA